MKVDAFFILSVVPSGMVAVLYLGIFLLGRRKGSPFAWLYLGMATMFACISLTNAARLLGVITRPCAKEILGANLVAALTILPVLLFLAARSARRQRDQSGGQQP